MTANGEELYFPNSQMDLVFSAKLESTILNAFGQPPLSLFKTSLVYFANWAKMMLTNYVTIYKQKVDNLQVDTSLLHH